MFTMVLLTSGLWAFANRGLLLPDQSIWTIQPLVLPLTGLVRSSPFRKWN